jgi:hypothetical protein
MGWVKKNIINPVVDFTVNVVKTVISPFTGGFNVPDIPDIADAQIESSTTVDFNASNKGIPICYGDHVERAVTPVFIATGGDKNQYLYMAGIIGLGFSQSSIYGSKLFNMIIDNTQVDITTAEPTAGGGALATQYTTSPASTWDQYKSSNGLPRQPLFGGKGNTQPITFKITSGKYKDRLIFQCFDGSDDQPSSSILSGIGGWGPDHRLRGCQYIAMRFQWNTENIKDTNGTDLPNPYSSLPQVVVMAPGKNVPTLMRPDIFQPGFLIDGVNDYDFVFSNSTYNHVGGLAQGYNTLGNPVHILLDYLLNDRFGVGLSLSKIDEASFINAAISCGRIRKEQTSDLWLTENANFFQDTLDYTYIKLDRAIGHPGAFSSRMLFPNNPYYRTFIVDTEKTHMENINEILTSIGAQMPYSNGKYKLILENGGTNTNPFDIINDGDLKSSNVFTFTDDNIVDGVNIQGIKLDETYNQVKVDYTDINNLSKSNSVVFPEAGSSIHTTYLEQDNQQLLTAEVTNRGIVCPQHALLYAKILLLKSRNRQVISFKTTEGASNLTPGDLVRVNSATLQIDDMYRITDINLAHTGEIEIQGFKHFGDNYDFTDNDIWEQIVSIFRKRPPVIASPAIIVSPPEGLIAFLVPNPVIAEFDATPTDILVKWRDSNSNTGTNTYEIQIKSQQSDISAFETLGTTTNKQFLINTKGYPLGQKFSLRIRTITNNGNLSDFTTTTVSTSASVGGLAVDSVFPLSKDYADNQISDTSGATAGTTAVSNLGTRGTGDI